MRPSCFSQCARLDFPGSSRALSLWSSAIIPWSQSLWSLFWSWSRTNYRSWPTMTFWSVWLFGQPQTADIAVPYIGQKSSPLACQERQGMLFIAPHPLYLCSEKCSLSMRAIGSIVLIDRLPCLLFKLSEIASLEQCRAGNWALFHKVHLQELY